MTPADALAFLDRRIADTVYRFGGEGYPTLTMKEARAISQAFHIVIDAKLEIPNESPTEETI